MIQPFVVAPFSWTPLPSDLTNIIIEEKEFFLNAF